MCWLPLENLGVSSTLSHSSINWVVETPKGYLVWPHSQQTIKIGDVNSNNVGFYNNVGVSNNNVAWLEFLGWMKTYYGVLVCVFLPLV